MSYTKKGAEYVKRKYEFRGGGDYLAAERQSQPHCEKEKTCYTSDMKHHFESMKKGFTLAEVLITLGVIGIVAALTLPSVIDKYNEKVTIEKLTSAYSLLDNGFTQAISDYGTVDNWADQDNRLTFIYEKIMPKYFKVIKTCPSGKAAKNCNVENFTALGGDMSGYMVGSNYQTFVLANGINIIFSPGVDRCLLQKNLMNVADNGMRYGSYGQYCAQFFVDINGKQNPNRLGYDIFPFWLAKDGVLPSGAQEETIWCQTFEEMCKKKSGFSLDAYCTAWVIYNKNMDYLRCDDLSWDGKHTCKD